MGKSVSSEFARFINSPNRGPRRPTHLRPESKTRSPSSAQPTVSRPESHHLRLTTRPTRGAESSEAQRRTPLAEVVADCAQRWFQDTLKQAKNGDTAMQVLVGQMYYSGYGVARDTKTAKAWINRAAGSSPSAWKVGDKHPGN
ncbi:Unknown protein [Striga hermonthica]|uniref:Uncharacterized protein n=1 Tax=Striga hermonthica TaxID=68872 RepID=A0A9N7RMX9_STRHE|nr:Unknown protein [Striga hermonthica]